MNDTRIAWLVPAVRRGAYWQPVLREFTKRFKNTVFYTSQTWPGFDPTAPGCSAIEIIGKYRFAETQKVATGYNRGFILASPTVVAPLLKFKPDVVFVSSFSLWTLLAILLKPVAGWRIVLVYESSSPNVDFRDDRFRTSVRRWMTQFVDTFVSNSRRGREYLIDVLSVPDNNILARPYMVPDPEALLEGQVTTEIEDLKSSHPIFLCVGLLVPRKGVNYLLEACALLKQQGYSDYTLVLVGDGEQREELQAYAQEKGIDEQIVWTGWLEYGQLGAYFRSADVFVFPTLEDTWGVVLLEAMAFGKAILCSKWAGASEMVVEGENGYIFDPYEPETLASGMKHFLDEDGAIAVMGEKSQQLIAEHNPVEAAKFLGDRATSVLAKS